MISISGDFSPQEDKYLYNSIERNHKLVKTTNSIILYY